MIDPWYDRCKDRVRMKMYKCGGRVGACMPNGARLFASISVKSYFPMAPNDQGKRSLALRRTHASETKIVYYKGGLKDFFAFCEEMLYCVRSINSNRIH